ncbi:two-component system histidine kinase PnpS [Loigolactobacillus zhaoyuanensis]|uniref:histidine kinase n=1 Tax=Loigolactobacillus zhaoyuanensis TaxID=2486017 RepID=A0ABW8UFA1_9LACO|nr:ATP-binding protein [Loigolactobacillus zhaoyuanensis]
MKRIKRIGWLIFGVITVGSAAIILFLNQRYVAEQQTSLAQQGQLLQAQVLPQLSTTKLPQATLKKWQQQQKVHVAIFDAQNQLVFPVAGPQADLIDSVVAFQNKTATSKSEQIRVAGRAQTAFLFSQKPWTLVLYTPQRNLWQPFWPQGLHLLIAVLGLSGLSVLIFYGYTRWERQSLQRVQQQLAQVGTPRSTPAVLLRPTDHYFTLERAVIQVDQQLQAQTALAQNEQQNFDRFIKHLTIGVLLLDETGNVVAHNPAAATMLAQPLSIQPHSYLNDVHNFALSRLIKQGLTKQQSQHATVKLVQPQERYLDVNVVWMKAQPVPATYQVAVLLYDITPVKQIQQMQLDFVSNVSHELKTPVTSISGFTETLLAGAQNEPAARQEFLEIIAAESQRLTALIQDIIALSRGQQQQLQVTTVNIKQVVQNLLVPLQQSINDKQLTIQLNIATTAQLQTDQRKFEQVVKNLLINGLAYNRIAGQLIITGEKIGPQWRLSFTDNGLGIAADDQARIFERFYRVDKARSHHQGGTGLGLAIVKELVTTLGGQVTLKSQLGVGSTFTIELPESIQ